ncbi:MAG: DUF3445 domain-containing protein [Agriterribacter sp.]
MKYLPFLSGKYSTAPGLTAIEKSNIESDKLIFQIDDHYEHYIENKQTCRKENIHKYYCEHNLYAPTIQRVNQYIVQQLLIEYPQYFIFTEDETQYSLHNKLKQEKIEWTTDWITIHGNIYLSLFDALCCQVQEDIAVVQQEDHTDWLATVHLCAPNHWSPTEKSGKTFATIHARIPGMDKTIQQHPKMLSAIIQKGPFTRFAWGVATDEQLNHHPFPPPGISGSVWNGRLNNQSKFFIRTERQNLVGFLENDAFLFTIRTYFYDIDDLAQPEKEALWQAIRSMSNETLIYKGMDKMKEKIERKLFH